MKVQPSSRNRADELLDELSLMKPGAIIAGFLSPYLHSSLVHQYAKRQIVAFALEWMPDLPQAMAMHAWQGQQAIAGYRAVLEGFSRLPVMAGAHQLTSLAVPPTEILVIGATPAGMQAALTAKALGAHVTVMDPRAEMRVVAESAGAEWVGAQLQSEDTEGEQSDLHRLCLPKYQTLLEENIGRFPLVICAAYHPHGTPPVVLHEALLYRLAPGAVIVDLAAGYGGNCAQILPDQQPVQATVLRDPHLATSVAGTASALYAEHLFRFIKRMMDPHNQQMVIDRQDPLIAHTLLTWQGKIVHPLLATP